MGHASTPEFRTFHALRIKGFATVDTLSEMTRLDASAVQEYLEAMAGDGRALFREARALWQLTPDGREVHGAALRSDLDGVDVEAILAAPYAQFLEINSGFKALCGDWQLRDGEINDHSDEAYDAGVLDRLTDLDRSAQPVIQVIGAGLDRFEPYAPRLSSTLTRLLAGESNMFTGVMCGSYHDAWMELHEDLILSQGIDRAAEGSF